MRPHSEATFEAYGCWPGDLAGLREAMPDEHLQALADLPWCLEHPELLVVHAGLQPDRSTARQLAALRARDGRNGRPPWLCDHGLTVPALPPDCERIVISGHRVVERVHDGPRRVLLDTGAGYGLRLSAWTWPERRVIDVAV